MQFYEVKLQLHWAQATWQRWHQCLFSTFVFWIKQKQLFTQLSCDFFFLFSFAFFFLFFLGKKSGQCPHKDAKSPRLAGLEHLCADAPAKTKKKKRKENERFIEVKRSKFKKKKRKKMPS